MERVEAVPTGSSWWLAATLLASALLLGPPAASAQLILPTDGCWDIGANVLVTACLRGHCQSQRARKSAPVCAPAGTRVEVLLAAGACSPDELAGLTELVPTPSGKLKLRVVDRPGLIATLRGCSGYQAFRLSGVGGRFRIDPNGTAFRGTVRVAFRIRAQGYDVGVTVVAQIHGDLTSDLGGFASAPRSIDADTGTTVAQALATALGQGAAQ